VHIVLVIFVHSFSQVWIHSRYSCLIVYHAYKHCDFEGYLFQELGKVIVRISIIRVRITVLIKITIGHRSMTHAK